MSSRAASCWRRCGHPGCPTPQTRSGDLRKAPGGRASCGKGPGWTEVAVWLAFAGFLSGEGFAEVTRGRPLLARAGGSVATEDRRPAGSASSHCGGRDRPPTRPHPATSTRVSSKVSLDQQSGARVRTVTCFSFFLFFLLQERGQLCYKFSGCHPLPPLHGLVYRQTCAI